MFASKTLIEHVLRGAVGIGALCHAVAIAEVHPFASLALGHWCWWRFAAVRCAGRSGCSRPQGSISRNTAAEFPGLGITLAIVPPEARTLSASRNPGRTTGNMPTVRIVAGQ